MVNTQRKEKQQSSWKYKKATVMKGSKDKEQIQAQ
jgi:hypothetical protein